MQNNQTKNVGKLLAMLIFSLLLFASCEEVSYDNLIQIKFESADNVGPQLVRLWVDGDFNTTEWTLNDELLDIPQTSTECTLFLDYDDVAYLKFKGSDAGNTRYYGELNLKIPDVATELEFRGLSSDKFDLYIPVDDLDYIAQLTFHAKDKNTVVTTTYNPADIEDGVLLFEKSVLFDVEGFEKYGDQDYRVDILLLKDGQASPFLQKTLYLKQEYFQMRQIFTGKSQIGFPEVNSGDPALFVLADWKLKE